MAGEDDGRRGEPRSSHQVAGEEFWWEISSHHYTPMHLSGYLTGIGLSRLCITSSTRLENLQWTASNTSPIPYQSSSHHFPSSLFCFIALANQLSCCGYSLSTLLETKPPFA